MQLPDFAAEVDRLTLMIGISSRAERLRVAMRVVRQKIHEETGQVATDRDVLDWLKFAQSETDGVRLSLAKLAELAQGDDDIAQVTQPQQPPVAAVLALADEQQGDDSYDDGDDEQRAAN